MRRTADATEPVSAGERAGRSGANCLRRIGCWRWREGGWWRIGSNSRSSGRLRQSVESIQIFVSNLVDGWHRSRPRLKWCFGVASRLRAQYREHHVGREQSVVPASLWAPPVLRSPRGGSASEQRLLLRAEGLGASAAPATAAGLSAPQGRAGGCRAPPVFNRGDANVATAVGGNSSCLGPVNATQGGGADRATREIRGSAGR